MQNFDGEPLKVEERLYNDKFSSNNTDATNSSNNNENTNCFTGNDHAHALSESIDP